MKSPSLPRVPSGLSDISPPGSRFTPYAEAAETHSAVVFLVGQRAYKLKKPVDLGFLDFSTREKRLAVLRRELELNQTAGSRRLPRRE